MNIAWANSFVVYIMLHPNNLTLLDFKTITATYLIGRYTSWSRAPPDGKTGSKRKYQYQFEPNHLPLHLPEFQSSRKRCEYCYKEGFEQKTFVKCTKCRVFLRLVKERNCFMKHHFAKNDIVLSYFRLSNILWLHLHCWKWDIIRNIEFFCVWYVMSLQLYCRPIDYLRPLIVVWNKHRTWIFFKIIFFMKENRKIHQEIFFFR